MGVERAKRSSISRAHLERVLEALDKQDQDALRALIEDHHPGDQLLLLNLLSPLDRRAIYPVLDTEELAELLPLADEVIAQEMLDSLPQDRIGAALALMDTDDAADVLQWEDDEARRQDLIAFLPQADQAHVRELLSYPENSAGGLMQTELFSVPAKWRVRRVLEKLRRAPLDLEDIHDIYLVDNRGVLNGVISLYQVLRLDPEQPVIEGADTDPVSVTPEVDQERVAHLFKQHNLASMPVLDEGGHILGRITADDIFYVLEEEATEDLYRLANLGEAGDLHEAVSRTVAKRSSWLMLNLGLSTLTSMVVGIFEDSISRMAALAVLMPIIANVGGVGGIQTFTIVVRGIALGQINLSLGLRTIGRQAIVGLLNGLIIGAVLALVTWWRFDNAMLGALIAIAMLVSLIMAGLVGSALPIAMRRLNLDPPLASGLVTTVTDMTAFFTFLALATFFLIQ
ncbi:magnesium transporter [Thermithiobacillus plumbiphilus]|uniref:Magnesium transporter MgtE n=1 Tax=Thermithiobacillus plumbiphilus TaxID=1729899 RepID=A0ABU9D8X3_9PROT